MSDIWKINTLKSGGLELDILPGVGGRLWDVRYGGQSLLFQNPDLTDLSPDLKNLSALPTRSPQFGFPLWGGEKTWVAPDSDWPDGGPHPVLDSAPYDVTKTTGHALHMQSAICPTSHLQIERQIKVSGPNTFSIHHRVTNQGRASRFTGIWSVMMLDRPSQIGVIMGGSGEISPVFGNSTGMTRQHGAFTVFDCHHAQEFKSGVSSHQGRIIMRFPKPDTPILLICDTPDHAPEDTYAHNHEFEAFNSADYPYCEAEWHSPARHLKPGDGLTFNQTFSVQTEAAFRKNSATIISDLELLSCMS